jgi:hypothetical protein
MFPNPQYALIFGIEQISYCETHRAQSESPEEIYRERLTFLVVDLHVRDFNPELELRIAGCLAFYSVKELLRNEGNDTLVRAV